MQTVRKSGAPTALLSFWLLTWCRAAAVALSVALPTILRSDKRDAKVTASHFNVPLKSMRVRPRSAR